MRMRRFFTDGPFQIPCQKQALSKPVTQTRTRTIDVASSLESAKAIAESLHAFNERNRQFHKQAQVTP